MNLAYGLPPSPVFQSNTQRISRMKKIRSSPKLRMLRLSAQMKMKRCLRCNTFYEDSHNSPTACSFHGHATGEKGLFAFAPPHQGIDGEWSDRSGVIVYKWNDKHNRPNTGSSDGAAALSTTTTPRLANEAATYPMMTASHCTSTN